MSITLFQENFSNSYLKPKGITQFCVSGSNVKQHIFCHSYYIRQIYFIINEKNMCPRNDQPRNLVA